MNIAISGASGLIGRRLLKALNGHLLRVLSRHAGTNLPPGVRLAVWDPMADAPSADSLGGIDAVIHLAGEPVAQRWSDAAKRKILESRVIGTRHLVQGLAKLERPPATLICASAIGYYGSRGDEELTETSRPGSGFLSDVCAAWEHEADAAAAPGIRVVKLRIGIVLAAEGGALKQMLPPFRAGVGGPLGNGRQWMSWIHIDDLTGIIRHAIEQPIEGALNGTTPAPVTNAEFTRTLGKVLHRPAFLPVPGFGLKILFGEMSEILLASQKVLPAAPLAAGYRFRYPALESALRAVLGKPVPLPTN